MKKAEDALKYYKGYKGSNDVEELAFQKELEKLKAIVNGQKQEEIKLRLSDFCRFFFIIILFISSNSQGQNFDPKGI